MRFITVVNSFIIIPSDQPLSILKKTVNSNTPTQPKHRIIEEETIMIVLLLLL
jgi:hypothetical protein